MEVRMNFDDCARVASDKVIDSWPLQLLDPVVCRTIGHFILEFTEKGGICFTLLKTGVSTLYGKWSLHAPPTP